MLSSTSKSRKRLRQLRQAWDLRAERRRLIQWRGQREAEGCNIHASLEVSGQALPLPHIRMGPGCWIERDVSIWISPFEGANPTLTMKGSSFLAHHVYLGVHQPITIGEFVQIGAYSYIISANHRFERRDIPIIKQGFAGAPIVIEDDVWLGTHVVVLPGITIGKGAIVGAGSVVTKDIPAYEIWGGTPAKFISNRPE